MNSASDRHRVPDIVLERYRLGELAPAEAESLERRLREDPALRSRLDAIEASDADLERGGVPDRLAAGVGERSACLRMRMTAPQRSPATRWIVPAAVAVAAAAILVIVFPFDRFGFVTERLKGLKPSLTLFRRTPAGTAQIEPGSRLRAGDLVRVAYQAAGRQYGVVVSIDGRGGVTLHLPVSGHAAERLRTGDRVLLEQAYELDDAPRWETFYFVTGASPFDVAPVLEAARRAAASAGASGPPSLDLERGLEQVSVSFTKEGH
jgi:hypothetical protein